MPLKIQINLEKVWYPVMGLLLRNSFRILKLVLSQGDEEHLVVSFGRVFSVSLILVVTP